MNLINPAFGPVAVPNQSALDNEISTVHPLYIKKIPLWETVRDTMEGEYHIKQLGQKYLPMTSGQASLPDSEGTKRYDAYKKRARFYDIVAPSVRGLVGLAHDKPAIVELPPRMEYLLENADAGRMTLEDFARNVTRETLQTGRCPILVDSPVEGGDPYLVLYPAESLINWKQDEIGYYLAVFEEAEYEDEQSFSHECVTRYRVLKLVEGKYTVEVYEDSSTDSQSNASGYSLIEEYTLDHDFIPLSVAGSINTDAEPNEPPMLPIARSAISMYQLSADYRQSLFMTAQPTPVTTGLGDDKPSSIGADTVWHLPEGATAAFLEVSGNGITLTKEAIQDEMLKAEQHGSNLIQSGNQAEAAETLRLRMLAQYATLQSVVMSGAEAIEKSLRHIAVWMNIDPNTVSYKANTDFMNVVDLSQLSTLNQAVSAGNLPKTILFEATRQAGLTELDDEALDDLLEIEPPIL